LKFQYSLSSILWLTLCVALALSSVLMYRRMEKAERENVMLRAEAAYLTVGDESQFHAAYVKSYNRFAWRWRMFVPRGRHLVVKAYFGDVPQSGMPKFDVEAAGAQGNGGAVGTADMPLMILDGRPFDGEMVMNAELRQDKDGKWQLYLTFNDRRLSDVASGGVQSYSSIPLPDAAGKIIEGSCATTSAIVGEKGTESKSLDEPIVLLRHWYLVGGGGSQNQSQTPGIMIWVEEKK
jgi:hypothetical protein